MTLVGPFFSQVLALCLPASKLEPGAQLDRSGTSRKKSLRSPRGRLTEGWADHGSIPDQVRVIDCIKDVCKCGKTIAFFIAKRLGHPDILGNG